MEDKTGLKIKKPELHEEIRNALLYAAECRIFQAQAEERHVCGTKINIPLPESNSGSGNL
jgi:hypothetical protein